MEAKTNIQEDRKTSEVLVITLSHDWTLDQIYIMTLHVSSQPPDPGSAFSG